MKARVLFVDDDETFRRVLEREMREFGYEVSACASAEEALERLQTEAADVALLDLRLPGMDGLALLRQLKAQDPDLPALLLTGHGSVAEAVEAMRAGAYDFLAKPVALDALEQALRRALERRELGLQNQRLRDLVGRDVAHEILGSSPAVVELRAAVNKIARTEANVLVSGENGTGKELVARALHEGSERHRGTFVVVNCGAIPTDLIESELFGHDRGAFTGATRRRIGLLELADGGTLFLDEVGELPLAVQPALLRAVQFGELRSVGDERQRQVDVRVVSATNRDLGVDLERGAFREDLYHRLATLVIDVPPLRARGDDVELLSELFLQRRNAGVSAAETKHLTPAAKARLRAHAWTGNVRELENVITRLVTLVEGPTLDAADIDRHVSARRHAPHGGLPALDLETLERLAIVEALRLHDGNRQRAAAELGVAVKTLYNKVQRYSVEPAEWSEGR